MITIPIPKKTYNMSFRTALDGVDYVVDMNWNMRSGWYISMAAIDGTVIIPSRRIAVDWPLLVGATSELRPPGFLVLADATGENRQPQQDDIGETHFLVYVPQDELSAL